MNLHALLKLLTTSHIQHSSVFISLVWRAYHLALLAQNTPDLPIDARQLIELVVNKGDNHQRLALLKNLPLPPVELIKAQILASDDGEAIGQMNAYLQINPEGYGSHHMLSSGQSDQIVPLSRGNSNN